ncbi:MAG: hypothetical protein ABSF03_17605 [Streptosporangiaceae bacterium]
MFGRDQRRAGRGRRRAAYGGRYRVFSVDVQGTGAMVLAAVYAASRVTGIGHY